jgi:hypothetical protein
VKLGVKLGVATSAAHVGLKTAELHIFAPVVFDHMHDQGPDPVLVITVGELGDE